jgi:UDP-2,3-diacylglucosamine hydrolase
LVTAKKIVSLAEFSIMQKKIFFASDFHFGIPDAASSRKREDLFVRWLDQVGPEAREIFLMGDLFDFWFEYNTVVPRGYTRLLGKLAELTDSGVKIHLFRGNHDMWAFDYLNKELNIEIHRDPEIREFNGKKFYLAHGDGLGPGDHGYKFIKKVFQCRLNQWLFRWIHPDIGIKLGLYWSRKSRYASLSRDDHEQQEKELINKRLTVYSREILQAHPEIDCFIFGHWHLPMEIPLTEKCVQISLGDWLTHFTYAEFDGQKLQLRTYAP